MSAAEISPRKLGPKKSCANDKLRVDHLLVWLSARNGAAVKSAICTDDEGTDKVGIPEVLSNQNDGVEGEILRRCTHTSELARVCCRSLKTEERELKASTGFDG